MPYIGRSLGDGVRARYIYAATSGQTSFSGNDANGIALAYSDTLYMDVYQNGVLLKPVTDYASTTGTSVVLVTGASTDDVVEMIVYDSFAVADTVSAANGGTFTGNMAMGGTLGVTGITTATGGLNVGTIKEATGSTTAITIDSSGIVDAKVPMFHATRTQQLTTASPYVCLFNTVVFDTDSWYATGTGRYTPQKAGYYYFVGQWSLATTNTSYYLSLSLRKNGTQTFNSVQYGGASTYPRPQVSGIFHCNGNDDYIDCHVSFSGGVNAIWTDIQGNNFLGHYLGTGS